MCGGRGATHLQWVGGRREDTVTRQRSCSAKNNTRRKFALYLRMKNRKHEDFPHVPRMERNNAWNSRLLAETTLLFIVSARIQHSVLQIRPGEWWFNLYCGRKQQKNAQSNVRKRQRVIAFCCDGAFGTDLGGGCWGWSGPVSYEVLKSGKIRKIKIHGNDWLLGNIIKAVLAFPVPKFHA